MGRLEYAVHAYAWTGSWSNATLDLIDRAKRLGFDMIEIPLMEVELVDPAAVRERLSAVGIAVCTSTVLAESTDITAEDEGTRRSGVEYLKRCAKVTADMGGSIFTGVVYSALGRRLDRMPDDTYWERAAAGLKEAARYARYLGVTIGIEPVNRYVNTCDQALRLREMVDEPNVAVHLDAYHMNIEETDFYEPTRKAVPHLCHFHLSESHRGTPGTGLVDWDGIYRALGETGYTGCVGLESFAEVSEASIGSTFIWRKLVDSSDQLLTDGLRYLKALEDKYCG
jgi:D-psicose/D-tagatose/L-ribulose 3-epimerase